MKRQMRDFCSRKRGRRFCRPFSTFRLTGFELFLCSFFLSELRFDGCADAR
jgi:hypothetical protein